MKTVSMSGSLRENVGKKDARKQRKDGLVPCVLYGGKEQFHFVMPEKDFKPAIFTPDALFIELELSGKKYDCILKEVQYHPVSDKILHADFMEFTQDKPVILEIPIKLKGNAPGLLKGGQLVKKFRKLPVKALPKDMPQIIEIDISNLEVNDRIKIGDLVQEKYKIMEKAERFVVGIMPTRITATGGEAGAAAPEAGA
jgi:large subunit ribosomal protein L25